MSDVVTAQPRRPVGLAAGLAGLALVAGGVALTRHTAAPAATAPPSPSPSESPSPTPTTLAEPLEPTFVAPPDPPDWLLPAFTAHTGLAVATTGTEVDVVALDTGARLFGPRLAPEPDTVVTPVARTASGWLLLRHDACGDFPCPPGEAYHVTRSRAVLVGRANAVYPDPDGRSVWLVTVGRTPEDGFAERRLLTGARAGRRTAFRGSAIGATTRGLVVGNPYASGAVGVVERSGRVASLGRGRVFGAAGRTVVVAPGACDDAECRLATLDVVTGETRPAGFLPDQPDFTSLDPTGRWLAALGRGETADAVVVDLRDGVVTRLPGVPGAAAAGWAPDGPWLVLARHGDADAAAGTLAVWRPGWASPRRAPGRRPWESLLIVRV